MTQGSTVTGNTTAPLPPDPSTLPHDSLQANIAACAVVTWLIATLFVGLRFYARGYIIRVLGPSDWCILAALVFAGATSASTLEQVAYGQGKHAWDVPVPNFPDLLRSGWLGLLWYQLALASTKISILLLYLHIFQYDRVRLAGQVLLAVVVISSLYALCIVFAACVPLRAFWDYSIRDASCRGQDFYWASTGMHMVTDWLIFLLPMPAIWSLTLPRRHKQILVAVFGLGLFVCTISVFRLISLIDTEVTPDPDPTFSAAGISYWTSVETNAGVVCACVMTLKPLVARLAPRFLDHARGGGGAGIDCPDGAVPHDSYGPPLTVGSRPMAAPAHLRQESWLPEYPGKVDGTTVGDVELGHREAESAKDDEAGEAVESEQHYRQLHHDDGAAGLRHSAIGIALSSPPPKAHLRLPGGGGAAAYYVAGPGTPSLTSLSVRYSHSLANGSMDSPTLSESTDWGPEVRPSSRH